MSYEIIYDKQFIKLSNDKYIPMTLAGSNNCYEVNWRNGKERRERSWFPWCLDVGVIGKQPDFLAYWEKTRKETIERNQSKDRDSWYEDYSDNRFGYWTSLSLKGKSCSQTSYKNITGIFTTGIKKALTIEQLAEEGVRVVVETGYISDKNIEIKPFSKVVANEVELFKAIDECKIHTGESSVETTIGFYGMQDETPKRLRERYFPTKAKREKTLVDFPKYYTIKIDESGNYFVKRTRNGYNYSYYPYLKFATRKEAESKVSRQNKRYGKIYSVEEILEPARIWI